MFKYKWNLNGNEENLVIVKLWVSQTYSVWEVIETYTTWEWNNWVAATPVKWIIMWIWKWFEAIPNFNNTIPWTANPVDLKTVTTDWTNSDEYFVFVETSTSALYSVDVNWIIWTTADSDKLWCRIDVDSANTDYWTVLETTATRTVATAANFYSHWVDEEDNTRLVVSIAFPENLTK